MLHGVAAASLCDRIREDTAPLFAEEYAEQEGRVSDAWRRGAQSVRELALLPEVQRCIGALYGRRPVPFQTLNFRRGSEQGFHSDAIHFTSVPEGFMCGVWVALEPVDESNGPLAYYPGSHRVPQFVPFTPGSGPERYADFERTQRELMHGLGVVPTTLNAGKGDAVIWASRLLHGGHPIGDSQRTRWSQVTHYFFENCIYYQPIYSDHLTGELKLIDVTDINDLSPVEHRYDSLQTALVAVRDGRYRIGLVDDQGTEVAGDAARTRALESTIANVTRERDQLKASRSFRLGNALASPVVRTRMVLSRLFANQKHEHGHERENAKGGVG